jgi:hypothetical protein
MPFLSCVVHLKRFSPTKINLKVATTRILQKWQTWLKIAKKKNVHNEHQEIKKQTCTMTHI